MKIGRTNFPRWLVFLIDTGFVAASVVLAYLLRFNFDIPESELRQFPRVLGIITGLRALSFLITRTYAGIIRYSSTQDAFRILLVIAGGSILFALGNILHFHFYDRTYLIPFSIIIIESITTLFAMTAFRLLVKVAYLELINPRRERTGVIIFGAGEAGLITKRTLDRDAGSKMRVVAFLDDDVRKAGNKLEGVNIMDGRRLAEVLAESKAETLIIAIQDISIERKNQIVDTCLRQEIRVMNIPPVTNWINGELSFRQLKDIRIEDLLGRDVIEMDRHRISKQFSGKRILITGASGSIGSELVRQLAPFAPRSLVLVDQAETPLFELELELLEAFPGQQIRILVADICHDERMEQIFEEEKPEIVFHSAAYKHVPLMENNPAEAVWTNIHGTRILADLSIKHKVEKFIMISTDKAVNPSSVMGASKRIAEIYTQSLNEEGVTRFITTRFGNVLGSNGSVIPLFKRQIEKGGPITVTHPDITRFFMTIPESCRLVMEAGAMGQGGEIFIFDMGASVKIVDLAHKMIKLSGLQLGKDIQLKFTGLRPGEKLYEELLNDQENTLPTYHPKIMIARVRSYELPRVKSDIAHLVSLLTEGNPLEIVKHMKTIVPEFRSSHSVFGQLDD